MHIYIHTYIYIYIGTYVCRRDCHIPTHYLFVSNVCCGLVQRVVVTISEQCVVVCCNLNFGRFATCRERLCVCFECVLQCITACCSHDISAVSCGVLQRVAVCGNAVCCSAHFGQLYAAMTIVYQIISCVSKNAFISRHTSEWRMTQNL